VFGHDAHAAALREAGYDPRSCGSYHASPSGPRMRNEDRVVEETCFTCHTEVAPAHYHAPATGEGDVCATCHVPLAETGFTARRVLELPFPVDHRTGSFLASDHGVAAASEAGRCTTCHTRERCLSCHVDVDNPLVAAVPRAGSELELPEPVAAYPVPESHGDGRWAQQHVPDEGVGSCNTCHTSDDCRACHVGAAPALVEALPARAEVAAPGVGLRPTSPGTHDSPFFMEAHATLAAASAGECATCHTDGYCTDCHDGASGNSYHPPDFALAHAPKAFGRADECASCHDTAVFCRSCHLESGLGASGRLGTGVAYHDAEPVWLLRHGQAARQNLESCASCHQQSECVQCHGVLGAFRVSPHRPGFDAARAWADSPRTCFACHVGNPLEGG